MRDVAARRGRRDRPSLAASDARLLQGRGEDRGGVPRRLVPFGRSRDRRRRGFISVVDRKKDMIKSGGENVASREVEEAIYRLPGVSEVAVIGVPHPHWVEAVVAVVVPKAGAALDQSQAWRARRRALCAPHVCPTIPRETEARETDQHHTHVGAWNGLLCTRLLGPPAEAGRAAHWRRVISGRRVRPHIPS